MSAKGSEEMVGDLVDADATEGLSDPDSE